MISQTGRTPEEEAKTIILPDFLPKTLYENERNWTRGARP